MTTANHKTSKTSSDAYVCHNELLAGDGSVLASFRTHWQAVAAMLRLSDPSFVSLGGDDPGALAIENKLKERLAREAAE